MHHPHPEDTTTKRFGAFLWGLFGFVFFLVLTAGIAGSVVLASRVTTQSNYPGEIAAQRAARLAEVVAAQQALLEEKMPIEKAMSTASRELRGLKPGASKIAVPGTAAALAQMEAQAAQPPADPPAPAETDGKPAGKETAP